MSEVRLVLDLHGELPESTSLDYQWLDAQERDRASRFVFAPHRRQFVRAHGLLRRNLAEALGLPAAEVAYERTAFGKPVLAGPAGARCQFNMSHCAGAILIGVAQQAIGVDIEFVNGRPFPAEISSTVFTATERASLALHSGDSLRRACFAHWTRKEAVLKAEGCGLSFEPSGFEVVPVEVAASAGEWNRDVWTAEIRGNTYYGVTSILHAGWTLSVACAGVEQQQQAMVALSTLAVSRQVAADLSPVP